MSNPTTKDITFGSVLFSLEGLRAIFNELRDIVREQGEIEISQLVRREDQSEEEFSDFKRDLRENVFGVLATVNFEDGSAVHSKDPFVLQLAPSGPLIRSFYLSNITPYKSRIGVEPEHMFQLFIDLRQPPLFDASQFVSSPTDNNTNLSIRGSRTGWGAGIEAAVRRQILRKRPIRTFFHGPFTYDLFLMLVGIPLGFYSCWLASNWANANLAHLGAVVLGAFYLYVGFAALWVYRFIFSYTKWAFPVVEIKEQATRPARHRKLWWGLVVLLAGKVFWDFADPYISLRTWWQGL